MDVQTLLATKKRPVITTVSDATIRLVLHSLRENKIGALVVVDPASDEITGIISERDIIRGLARYGVRATQMHVRDFMSRNVKTCSMNDSLTQIMRIMNQERIRHVPVVENGKLCGIVSIGDVVKYRIQELDLEVRVMQDLCAISRAANAS